MHVVFSPVVALGVWGCLDSLRKPKQPCPAGYSKDLSPTKREKLWDLDSCCWHQFSSATGVAVVPVGLSCLTRRLSWYCCISLFLVITVVRAVRIQIDWWPALNPNCWADNFFGADSNAWDPIYLRFSCLRFRWARSTFLTKNIESVKNMYLTHPSGAKVGMGIF